MSMLFKVMGQPQRGQAEQLDESEKKGEAEYLAREYRIAYGESWSIWIEEMEEDEEVHS